MEPLLASIRESYGRVVYTHKTHEKERERQSRIANLSKWTNVVLGAITLGGVIAALGTSTAWVLFLSIAMATLNVGYALVQLSFDPRGQAGLHRAAAKQLLIVRNHFQALIADIKSGCLSDDQARNRRDELDAISAEAYRLAPDTSRRAYARAQRSLKFAEDMTFSVAEIDALLPHGLRETSEPPTAQQLTADAEHRSREAGN